jgi:hypothetical protein
MWIGLEFVKDGSEEYTPPSDLRPLRACDLVIGPWRGAVQEQDGEVAVEASEGGRSCQM